MSACGSFSTAWSRSAFRASAISAVSSPKAFDGAGNYTLGLKEQIVFPEIDFDKVDMIKGMNITFVTSAGTNDEAKALSRGPGHAVQELNRWHVHRSGRR